MAEFVAAFDDGNEGGGVAVAVREDGWPKLAAQIIRGNAEDRENLVEVLGTGEDVHVGEAAAEGVVLRPNHAAHHGDLEGGVFTLEVGERPELGSGAVLGVLADGASIEDDEVGVCGMIGGVPAEAAEAGGELAGVGLVDLTADGPNVIGAHCDLLMESQGTVCRLIAGWDGGGIVRK